ncbi:MAG: ABC transporter permease [Acidobacteria bacterium]|nr:ABC transporter permease [Acidobacteriota bacterium]
MIKEHIRTMASRFAALFISGDERPEAEPVAVMSHGLWKRRFGSDSAVLGQTLTLDGIIYSIIGILPANYSLPGEVPADLWIPLPIQEDGLRLLNTNTVIEIIGRLKPGSDIQTAQTELDRAYQETIKARPRKSDDYLVAVKWENELAGETRSTLFLFLGVVGAVLLIACANIANLLFARTIAREDELRLRAALGAGRIRIFRQLMTESLLLALLGGGLGFLVTFWTKGFLVTLVSQNLVSITSLPVDLRVFGFTLLVSAATAIIAGVVPAWRAACFSPSLSINEGRRATTGKGLRAVFRLFVTVQIALVLTLLISSGFLLKTLLLLRQIDPGFQPEKILTVAVAPSAAKYPDDRARTAYYEQVLERLQTIPGIESAGITTYLPFGAVSMAISGGDKAESSEEVIEISETFRLARVSEDYFRTMKIPLLEGRLFSRFDGRGFVHL